jgi:hypothetical protein
MIVIAHDHECMHLPRELRSGFIQSEEERVLRSARSENIVL